MSNQDLLLGIDFGTGGCKITVIDQSGNIIESISGEYQTSHPQIGWAEQNPADWYEVMCGLLNSLKCRDRIAALSFDSYTHGAVMLDKEMQVIRPTIIWTDQRSTKETEFLSSNYQQKILDIAYQAPAPTWTLPQMLWLKNNEPETLEKTHHISFVKDHIRYLMTGESYCDNIESQGTLFWDMKNECWSEELCEMVGIKVSQLPEIKKPTDLAGSITAQAAADTGLKEGTPVVMGASDSAIEDYAAGAIEPGQCILKLATAGNVNVMTADAHPTNASLTYSHVVPGMWYTVTATNAAAVCQRWFRNNICTKDTHYDELDRMAEESPIGSNGVFFHPYLQGERSPYWDSDLRGSFTGLSMASTKGDMSRALLEGVAFSLKDCYRTIEEMGLDTYEFILIGGGAKSKIWSRIVCDLFNAPVKIPSSCDASYGSALLAGVGVGIFPDERSAIKQCLKLDRQLEPNKENAARYQQLFSHYREIHDVMAGAYKNINKATLNK